MPLPARPRRITADLLDLLGEGVAALALGTVSAFSRALAPGSRPRHLHVVVDRGPGGLR